MSEPTKVIDLHAHLIPPEITREQAPEESWRPRVYWEDGASVIETGSRKIRSAVHDFLQVEAALEAQAAAGVDFLVLCPWIGLMRYNAEPQECLRSSQILNAGFARMVQEHPGQIAALGSVPMQEPALAASELHRLMKETVLCGVEISASVNGIYLGDDRFIPFWEAAEETGALVFIHPTTNGLGVSAFDQYYLKNTAGNPLETTITAAHMAMAGVMESHPQLKVLLSHGGGAVLALRGRLDQAHSFQPEARARLHEKPSDSLKRFYFDTITHDRALLSQLVSFAGVEHVVVGSDYPFNMGVQHPAEIVRQLGLPPADEAKILNGNALQLMNR